MTTNAAAIASRLVDKVVACTSDRNLRIEVVAHVVRELMTSDLPRQVAESIAEEFRPKAGATLKQCRECKQRLPKHAFNGTDLLCHDCREIKDVGGANP